jgi:hypothetical protein
LADEVNQLLAIVNIDEPRRQLSGTQAPTGSKIKIDWPAPDHGSLFSEDDIRESMLKICLFFPLSFFCIVFDLTPCIPVRCIHSQKQSYDDMNHAR